MSAARWALVALGVVVIAGAAFVVGMRVGVGFIATRAEDEMVRQLGAEANLADIRLRLLDQGSEAVLREELGIEIDSALVVFCRAGVEKEPAQIQQIVHRIAGYRRDHPRAGLDGGASEVASCLKAALERPVPDAGQ